MPFKSKEDRNLWSRKVYKMSNMKRKFEHILAIAAVELSTSPANAVKKIGWKEFQMLKRF